MANYHRRRGCPFVENGTVEIDYKDIDTLKDYVIESGRMLPSRITGVSARYQRQLSLAIKRARFLALMPYCDTHF